MRIPNYWPQTASFNYCGVPAFQGTFISDHYEGQVSEQFREAFHNGRLKAFPDHEVECILDNQNEVIGYDIRKAKFNLVVES